MPHNTNLAISLLMSCVSALFDCFIYCIVLMVCCNFLYSSNTHHSLSIFDFFLFKNGKISDQIEEYIMCKHSLAECFYLWNEMTCFLFSIFCFPFHKTSSWCCQCSSLRIDSIRNNHECIVYKKIWDSLFIRLKLLIGFLECRFFIIWIFKFNKNNGYSIDKTDDIRSFDTTIILDTILVCTMIFIIAGILKINQLYTITNFFSVFLVFYCNTFRNHTMKCMICFTETPSFDIL